MLQTWLRFSAAGIQCITNFKQVWSMISGGPESNNRF